MVKNSMLYLNTPDFKDQTDQVRTNVNLIDVQILNNEFRVPDNDLITTAIIYIFNVGHVTI